MVTHYNRDPIPAVYGIDGISRYEPRDGFSFRFFRSLHNTLGFVHADAGAETNLHRHPWEQVVHVVDGEANFYVDGEEFSIEEGDVFFIPPDAEHELRPKADASVDLVAVWPLQEEFVPRTSYQTEFDVDAER